MGISNKNIIVQLSNIKNISHPMSQTNNQNINAIQQKYQAYKANHIRKIEILSAVNQNIPEQTSSAPVDNYYSLLMSDGKNNQVFETMLSDKTICELSENLKKVAQEKNNEILISSFPARYKQLLEIQAQFNTLLKRYNQQVQERDLEVTKLKQKLLDCNSKIKQLTKHNNDLVHQLQTNQQAYFTQLGDQIRKKQTQIFNLRDSLQISERKIEKCKTDYKSLSQVVVQLREQEEQHRKQMQRLIDKLKEAEQKTMKAHKKLLHNDDERKQEIQKLIAHHEVQILQAKERERSLEELLQQAQNRIEYKESLIKLIEQENQRNISQLEDQNVKKLEEMQKLKQQYLAVLKALDESDQKLHTQQQKYLKESEIWELERDQLKKQLQKCYQLNGQLKAQLDTKTELNRILEKSVQCLQITSESDLLAKNKEIEEITKKLDQIQQQLKESGNKIVDLLEVQSRYKLMVKDLNEQNKELNDQNKRLQQKIAQAEKNVQKLLEKEQSCSTLKRKVEDWIISNTNPQQKQSRLLQKIFEYQKLIQKLKQQIISLTNSSRSNASNQNKIVKDLIEQNKSLKKQIHKYMNEKEWVNPESINIC